MGQMKLFDIDLPQKPINVASVIQRSPFRYPGGKTWFVPYAIKWLKQYNGKIDYIEPFAGGGIIGLTCAFERLAESITLVELDTDIASVWKAILGTKGKHFAEKVLNFDVSYENISKEFKKPVRSEAQRAFVTFLKNRLHHGGILANGAGLIKNGEKGKGLKSRWYPETLYRRIMDIIEIKDRIKFIQGDGFEIIRRNAENQKVVFFIDPPYTKAGKRLYTHCEINHVSLFDLVSNVKGDFLITYDDAKEIESLAHNHGFDIERVVMKTTLHYEKYELVIGRNLDWLRELLEVPNKTSIFNSEIADDIDS
ncbi:MAG TPA: DNA adenine methylase [Anaerohalosphaeraceae bacterium]|nr:DNA adenine methylase [Anaerohalosphaeraceae bacterium]HPB92932.1 DNA adenine methylase [Anaerohalosphaeraceae bacterium]